MEIKGAIGTCTRLTCLCEEEEWLPRYKVKDEG